jgi:hypothetical protein
MQGPRKNKWRINKKEYYVASIILIPKLASKESSNNSGVNFLGCGVYMNVQRIGIVSMFMVILVNGDLV